MVLGISAKLNKFTPGMPFKCYAYKVLYKGNSCGYIEEAGKRKYYLTPILNKLERKMELNDFNCAQPRTIDHVELDKLKHLLKPLIRNEKGMKAFINRPGKTFQFSPSPAAVTVWDKDADKPVITIVKELSHPTREIFFHRFPLLRKVWRISPFV